MPNDLLHYIVRRKFQIEFNKPIGIQNGTCTKFGFLSNVRVTLCFFFEAVCVLLGSCTKTWALIQNDFDKYGRANTISINAKNFSRETNTSQ